MSQVVHQLEVLADPEQVARRAARLVAATARTAVADRGRFTFAVSGGRTPWAMFGELASEDVPWERISIFQVDERVAPPGDPDRNLTHLRESLGDAVTEVVPMPVNDEDLDQAAGRYDAMLPDRFDLVHLGLGPDGHTASLVPGDPVLDIADRRVALTREYRGRRRMTLTFPAIDAARLVLWLITGADKSEPLRLLMAGDRSIPGGRVRATASTIFADRAAAG